MKQYMLIQFKPTEDPNYYQSKNNIIQALNKGEFVNVSRNTSIKIQHCGNNF